MPLYFTWLMTSNCFICKKEKTGTLSGQSVLNRINKFEPCLYPTFVKEGGMVNLSGRRYCNDCLCEIFPGVWEGMPRLHQMKGSVDNLRAEQEEEEEEEEPETPMASPPKKARTTTPAQIAEGVAKAISSIQLVPPPVITPEQRDQNVLLQMKKDIFTSNFNRIGATLNIIKIRGLKSPSEMKRMGSVMQKLARVLEEDEAVQALLNEE